MCGKCDPNKWMRSKILVRADGTPAPLCSRPCYDKEAQADQEGAEGGLIPHLPPDPTAAPPPHHDTNTAPVTRHVHPAKTRHVHNH